MVGAQAPQNGQGVAIRDPHGIGNPPDANKSFTVDSQATILGGRNIGNEYFEANPDLAFADLDVLAIGPVAREVTTAFDRYWNSELAYPYRSWSTTPRLRKKTSECGNN